MEVEALCDHIATLDDGKLCFVGSPRDCSTQFGNGESLEQAYLKLVTRDNELKDLT
jgi:ABC-type multidrug transport system ATPase subunit